MVRWMRSWMLGRRSVALVSWLLEYGCVAWLGGCRAECKAGTVSHGVQHWFPGRAASATQPLAHWSPRRWISARACQGDTPMKLLYLFMMVVVDSSISMMTVLLWMGSEVAVEAYPWFSGSATSLTYKVATRNCWTIVSSASFALRFSHFIHFSHFHLL